MTTITTSQGSTVTLREEDGETVVSLDNPEAPASMRGITAGRIVHATDGTPGFQPAPFAMYAVTPEVLRAIADLIDTTHTPKESN